jgi:putative phosphoesterase
MKIGVISDTHGLLRPETVTYLQGCDHILHAGDIGDISILKSIEAIAPVTAIRGNIDERGTCRNLPATDIVELDSHLIYLIHDVNALDLDPAAAGFAAVISGHSHKAKIERIKNVLYFNPGSCGPQRFTLPITMGLLTIAGTELKPEILTLI